MELKLEKLAIDFCKTFLRDTSFLKEGSTKKTIQLFSKHSLRKGEVQRYMQNYFKENKISVAFGKGESKEDTYTIKIDYFLDKN